MTVAQWTPRVEKAKQWIELDGEQVCVVDSILAEQLEAENAALSAQVVELQQINSHLGEKMRGYQDLQLKAEGALRAAKAEIERLMLVHSTVTRASVPPSVKDSGAQV